MTKQTTEELKELLRLRTEEENEKRRARVRAANLEAARLEAEFRVKLEAEHDMTGHPKADLLYGKAWQMGHSAGLEEVGIYYSDLVELVK